MILSPKSTEELSGSTPKGSSFIGLEMKPKIASWLKNHWVHRSLASVTNQRDQGAGSYVKMGRRLQQIARIFAKCVSWLVDLICNSTVWSLIVTTSFFILAEGPIHELCSKINRKGRSPQPESQVFWKQLWPPAWVALCLPGVPSGPLCLHVLCLHSSLSSLCSPPMAHRPQFTQRDPPVR